MTTNRQRRQRNRRRALRPAAHRPVVPEPDRARLEVVWAEAMRLGIEQVTRADLERWRYRLMPAEFQRFCHRLDQALTDLTTARARASWTQDPLPFDNLTEDHE